MTDPITKEERAQVLNWADNGGRGYPTFVKPSIRAYEAALSAAEERVKELEEALEPLCDIAQHRCADDLAWSDTDYVQASITIGALRRARAVMKGVE